MANAAAVFNNQALAAAAVITASSQQQTLPVSNLQTPHVSERWRSASNADYFTVDKGSLVADDTVMVRGMTASVAATARLRLSTSDPASGDVLDTGALASGATAYFDLTYGAFVYLLAAAPSAWRYARFDIADTAASYVEAGVVCIGTRNQFDINFEAGESLGYVDRTRLAQTAGGLTLTWPDNKFRRWSVNFPWIDAAQRYGFVEQMDLLNGKGQNVLMIRDTGSANLARDSIFGLVTDLAPVTLPEVIDIFGKVYNIDERL
jgi:hypothetical protein